MHSTVSLRFYSRDLTPEEITSRLGTEPTQIQQTGEGLSGRPFLENMWGYSDEGDPVSPIDVQIRRLLNTFMPIRDRVLSLGPQVRILFWCALFSHNPEATLIFHSDVLADVASLGAEMHISVYQAEDEGEDSRATA